MRNVNEDRLDLQFTDSVQRNQNVIYKVEANVYKHLKKVQQGSPVSCRALNRKRYKFLWNIEVAYIYI
jgi:hypothetical protein